MILSFAWTTNALLTGRKTVTRRVWKDITYQKWVTAWLVGDRIHAAWNQLPFVPGSRKVGEIRLTCQPFRQPLGQMPEADLEAEGGLWSSRDQFIQLLGGPDETVTVVRFELIHVEPGDYPATWPLISLATKKKAEWRCEHCQHPHVVATGHVLTVHHLNGNPADCRPENLVALCQRCHLRLQNQMMPGQLAMDFYRADWMKERGIG